VLRARFLIELRKRDQVKATIGYFAQKMPKIVAIVFAKPAPVGGAVVTRGKYCPATPTPVLIFRE
jgi:hypothetical protein